MFNKNFTVVFLLALLLQGCGLPFGNNTSSGSSAPATEAATTGPTTIQHVMTPGASSSQAAYATDNEEIKTHDSRTVTNGDDYRFDRFERPFTSKAMDYVPFVDIVDFAMTSDKDWYYVQIKLAGLDASGNAPATYGVEFDLDQDGRSDLLMTADKPGNNWSVEGVHVYLDANGDVGGFSSAPDDIYTGNGFETTVFDAGKGDDPDLAWAHLVNSSSPIVELALKLSLFEKYHKFLWSVLASATPIDPTRLYYNDTYSEEQAGSPTKGNKYYPVNQLAEFDNTCRVPFGFTATGTEPLGCSVATPKDRDFTPGKPTITLTITGTIGTVQQVGP